MAFTTNQWIIVALVLLLGWLLGLASRSGGAKWRDQAAADRARADAAEARIAASNQRIAELERHDGPIGVGTAGAVAATASGRRDDLSAIHGVGSAGETRLNEAGYHRFTDVARMSDGDAAALEGRLGAEPGTIAREEWREQADLLSRDRDAHAARWRR